MTRSKKYKTNKAALSIPQGTYIRDLSKAELTARLQKLQGTVRSRAHRLRQAGYAAVAEIPATSIRGKTRAQLAHQFTATKLWLEGRQTSTVSGARAVFERTAANLGLSTKGLGRMSKKKIGKVFETFHKIQEIRPEWFTGKYSNEYLAEVRKGVEKGLTVNQIAKQLQDIYDKEVNADSKRVRTDTYRTIR